MKIKLAALQMQIIDGKPSRNRETLLAMLDSESLADIYLAPELWSCGYVHEQWGEIADRDTPICMDWMSDQAAKRNIWLGGSLVARDSAGSLRNRFVLFNRSGIQVCEYDKAHLFKPLDEHLWLEPGTKLPPIVDVDGVNMAPAICYDLRFPEMFRRLAKAGAEVFLVVAEWPKPREHALKILAEARAIENQTYLILANRIGTDDAGVVFCGESGVFGPDGRRSEPTIEGDVVLVSVDTEELHLLHENFPVLSHCVQGIDYG